MQNILNLYFPSIRSVEDIAEDILEDDVLTKLFNEWTPERRMHFIDICTGRCGAKMLYEPFLPEMLHSSVVQKTMGAWLGNLTGQEMTVREISMDRASDVILMECTVELHRTGERRCIRFIGKEAFPPDWDTLSGKENLYTVIVLKSSPDEFQLYRREYMYYGCRQNDQKEAEKYPGEYCVFGLDHFAGYLKENGIRNMMDAWWVFLVCDEPNLIAQLVIKYPIFVEIYGKMYDIFMNINRTVHLLQNSRPHTDCGVKCAWLMKVEQLLEEQRKQNVVQAKKIESMQEVIDKQSYIISEQCRENAGDDCREKKT